MGIEYDAHNGSSIYHYEGPHSLDFLGTHLLSTPYILKQKPRVLVIGVGGGIDVMNAVWHGASHVTGVDLQPITINLLQGPLLKSWTGGIFERPEVELVASEGRHYVRSHDDRYDILQITAVDTFSAQTTGAYVLAESYLYTVEAFQDYLSHLTDDGILSIVVGDLPLGPSVPRTQRVSHSRHGRHCAAAARPIRRPISCSLRMKSRLPLGFARTC
jgi:spermidine synthase